MMTESDHDDDHCANCGAELGPRNPERICDSCSETFCNSCVVKMPLGEECPFCAAELP